MKIVLGIALCLSVVAADFSWDPQVIGGSGHYEQHRQSVEAARQSASAKLQAGGSSVGGSNAYLCGLCESSNSESSNFGQVESSKGVGFVYPVSSGGASSSSFASKYQSSQSNAAVPVVIPSASSASSSKYSSAQSSQSVSQSAPIIIPVGGGSESYASHTEKRVESNSAPVVTVTYPQASGASSYQKSASHFSESNSVPVHVPIFPSGESHKHSLLSERFSEVNSAPVVPVAPVYVPFGGSNHFSSNLGKFEEVHSAPSYQILQIPSAGNSKYVSEHASHHESTSGGGAVYPLPLAHGSLGSSSSNYISEHSSSGGLSGNLLVAPSFGSSGSSGSLLSKFGSSSNSFNLHGSGLSSYISESERLARQQAQNIQAQNIQAQNVVQVPAAGSCEEEANLDVAVNNANSQWHAVNPSVNQGKKSWETGSKWYAQQEYDSSGRVKSNSLLSTAEGEEQTINGKTNGFKAATTTVEEDGKRSTYSIHTP